MVDEQTILVNDLLFSCETYAMLDSCRQGTFMDEQLLNELQIFGKETTSTVKTINGEATELTGVVAGLKVRKDLLVESDVVKPSQIAKWKYLEQIKDELNLNPNVKIGLLIGANRSRALEPETVIHSQGDGPYTFRTVLGWCTVRPISQNNVPGGKVLCNRTAVIEAGTGNLARHHFETKSQMQENDLKQMIERMYQANFSEPELGFKQMVSNLEEVSLEDQHFLKLLDNGKNWSMGIIRCLYHSKTQIYVFQIRKIK